MKIRTILIIVTLFISCNLKGQKQYNIIWDYKNLTFNEFVSKAESQLHVKFFFKDEWVVNLRLSDYKGCKTLPCILDSLFKPTSLHYFINESGHVLITGSYTIKVLNAPPDNKEIFIPQTQYTAYVKEQQSAEILSVSIGNPADKNSPGRVILSGHITNKETKEPAPGVTVFVQNGALGTISNESGDYTITLPRGNQLIKFSFIGMKDKKVNLSLYGSGILNIEMNNSVTPLNEVIVTNQKTTILQRSEVGAEKINISSFKLLPTSLGETDIIKSLNLIPGVKSMGEGSSGFNVRGGSADQNLILLYKAPIYNSSHFFGFFSAVNSDIIKDVTLYKGGIPSRYGGRISSVLDIDAKEGNKRVFAGNAGISPITTHLMIEGPIIKDTLSYILTGRTTYSNWIFGLINDPYLHNSRASFYDLNGKLTYNLNKNNKIDFSSYLSQDYFKLNTSTIYNFHNNIIALKWQHFFNRLLYSTLSLNNSYYKYDLTNQDTPTDSYILSHKINSTGFKADFNWLKGRNEINFGLDVTVYSVMPGSYQPATDSSLIVSNVIERERALEGALYIEDKITVAKFMSVNAGFRMSTFYAFGPKTIYEYSPDFSKSKTTITDTLKYNSGKVYSQYSGPELRVSVNFRLSDKNSIKLNYNRTRQYIHLLSNSTSISPTDTWKLCDYYLKPVIGDQYAIGFYQLLFRGGFETSAEVYYKEMKNMVDFKGRSTLTMVGNVEQYLVNTKGKAYGLELSFKKTEGKLRYSVGYTYSRTFVKSLGKFREEIINSGNWYPANYDKPNDLIVTLNYLYSRRFSFSADYTYSTGRPITFPIATYHVDDIMMIQYSARNKYRIPDFSRLDVSCKISGNLRSHKIAHPNLIFSVYNLFARENAYSVYFRKVGETVEGYKLSVFGTAIPSVTFNFDF